MSILSAIVTAVLITAGFMSFVIAAGAAAYASAGQKYKSKDE